VIRMVKVWMMSRNRHATTTTITTNSFELIVTQHLNYHLAIVSFSIHPPLVSCEYLLNVRTMLFTSSAISTIFATAKASRTSLVCSHTYLTFDRFL